MRPKTNAIALVLLLALAAAGCGGKKSATDTGASSTTTTTTTAAATTVAAATTTSGGNAPSFASTKNCAQLVAMGEKFSQAMASATGQGTGSITDAAKAYKALADAAPSEIRSDFQTIAAAFEAYANAMKDAKLEPGKTPTASQLAALTAAAKSFSTEKVSAASRRLSAWSAKNCHG